MRLMRKQNGMIVPMKVSRWSISVWITDLKNSIGFLFLLLIFLSCGTKHTKYGDNVFLYSEFPQVEELKGEIIELDTVLFRYPFRIRVEGDKVIVMDLHGFDNYGHLFQYPDFHYLSSFGIHRIHLRECYQWKIFGFITKMYGH